MIFVWGGAILTFIFLWPILGGLALFPAIGLWYGSIKWEVYWVGKDKDRNS